MSFLDSSRSASLALPTLEETACAWLAAKDAENLEYVVFGGISLTVLLLNVFPPLTKLGGATLLGIEFCPPANGRIPTP